MRGLLLLSVIALVAGVVLWGDRAGLFGRRQGVDMPRYHGKVFRVTRVVDGDTLDVELPDGHRLCTRIRLWGVDTPESVRPDHPVEHFGPEASAFTRRVSQGLGVRVELLPHRTRDKFGRLLAYVYLPDGRMLNRLLIAEGYGYADTRFEHPFKTRFIRVQSEARNAGCGLWKNPPPNHLPNYLKKSN